MKKKKTSTHVLGIQPTKRVTAAQIREDGKIYGLRRDALGVREAKNQLSSLLQRAAGGEEIVITSDGVPAAMIVRYKPVIRGKPFKPHWKLLRSMPMTSDSTVLIRKMRDAGY
ncbi:MAG: type II toxin-antitoxin system prevent-host-death family antitoxin [Opitutaceae bacterium]|nr:type II toxin-antitoxin system prevent-host-death family antitoxin [Opitutaceae bacterium]